MLCCNWGVEPLLHNLSAMMFVHLCSPASAGNPGLVTG